MGYVPRDSTAADVIGHHTAHARHLRAAGQYKCARIIQEAEPDTKWVGRGLIYLIIEWKVLYKKCAQNSMQKSYSGKCPQNSIL